MAEPFVFHFSPDAHGRPEVMYIADVRVACELCKHPQLQRFYHSTPFHTLTIHGLEQLLNAVPGKAGYECENCGEMVGPTGVVAASLTYGFCDESGVVIGTLVAGKVSWRTQRSRRLDPQRLPVFDDEGVGEFSDDWLEENLGRVMSAKVALLDLISEGEPGWVPVSKHMAWGVAGDEDTLNELLDEIEDEVEFITPVFVDLFDAEPDGIGTHSDYSKLTGRWGQWLGPINLTALNEKKLHVGALVDAEPAKEVFERLLDVARLQAERSDVDGLPVWSEITTPGGLRFPHEISLEGILRRAVYTGITPGESARLTGEELAGILLRVWKTEAR